MAKKQQGKASDDAQVTPASRVATLAASLAKLSRSAAAPGELLGRVSALRQAGATLEELAVLNESFRAFVAKEEGSAKLELLQLEAELRDRCAKRDWQVDGNWPSFWIARAISLKIDEATYTAQVSNAKVVATATAIMQALDPLVEELLPARFLAAEFLDLLARAFDSAKASSAQVTAFDAYRALVLQMQKPKFWRNAVAGNFTPLTLDQFRARLSATLEQLPLSTPDGREIRVAPPLDAKDGLFVFLPHERRFAYVGQIEFVGVTR